MKIHGDSSGAGVFNSLLKESGSETRNFRRLFNYMGLQETQQIFSVDYTAFEPTFMISNDLGFNWTHTFQINLLSPTWAEMRLLMTSYLGNGRIIAFVYDGFSNFDYYFEGIAMSSDYGQTWQLISSKFDHQGNFDESIQKIGVVTNNPALDGLVYSTFQP